MVRGCSRSPGASTRRARNRPTPPNIPYPISPDVLVPQVVDPLSSPSSLGGWISQQSRLLGAVRLRQVRVATNSSCVPSALVAHLANRSSSCWAAASAAAIRTAPIYGADLDGNGTRRVYRHTPLANSLAVSSASSLARLRSYPTSGYQVDLPGSRAYADEVPRLSRLPPPALTPPGTSASGAAAAGGRFLLRPRDTLRVRPLRRSQRQHQHGLYGAPRPPAAWALHGHRTGTAWALHVHCIHAGAHRVRTSRVGRHLPNVHRAPATPGAVRRQRWRRAAGV